LKQPADKGSFQDPSVYVRPKFRYWIPDASIDHEIAASDIKAAGEVGAGGMESLGFYLYGGPPANAFRGTAAPVSWATYGYGTDEWSMKPLHFLLRLEYHVQILMYDE
jgi:hypothetical protein